MVSKKALIGIGLALIIIGFGSVVLIQADRLQISTARSTNILLTGGGFLADCNKLNCFAEGTEIPNSCFQIDSTRSCTFQINDVQNPTRVEEKEGVIIIRGENTLCFLQGDGFGGVAPDPLLLCVDDGRFDKKWWVLGERTEVGLDLFVTINVIGDLSFGERTGQLQEMGLIGIP